jgi:hypothetical protein
VFFVVDIAVFGLLPRLKCREEGKCLVVGLRKSRKNALAFQQL